jgi:pimeloyl-ACP methyl ester carboxylesterase
MFLTLPDATLFTISFGLKTAPPILALSGWIGSWEDWADTLSLLSERWRAISFDHRGSGATIAPTHTNFRNEAIYGHANFYWATALHRIKKLLEK